MVSPQLEYAEVNGSTLILSFDQELDTDIDIPEESFKINFGKIGVLDSSYIGTSRIELYLDSEVGSRDIISISYDPPIDVTEALRGPIESGASVSSLRKRAVKAIYKFRVNNRTPGEPGGEDSNLGEGINGLGYPRIDRPSDPRSATPGDFILAYGEKEAIGISNIDDARETEPNLDRIWMAIQDAEALIDSYIQNASKSCIRLVSSNRRRTSLAIARYYLDTVRRREDVFKDYELCIKELQGCDSGSPNRLGDESARDDVRGILRTGSVPQVYNRGSGLGLRGWWVDPADGTFLDNYGER